MLLALLSAVFALSQSYRTITAILAQGLTAGLWPVGPGAGRVCRAVRPVLRCGAAVHGHGPWTCYGLRRTVLASAFPLSIAGATLSALAPSHGGLMAGAAADRRGLLAGLSGLHASLLRGTFPAERFAFSLGPEPWGVGGLGLMLTGTPLAWVVQHWRLAHRALASLAAPERPVLAADLPALVHEPPLEPDAPPRSRARELGSRPCAAWPSCFTLPHTWGILLLGMSCYAAFLSLRGLWLGPLLDEPLRLFAGGQRQRSTGAVVDLAVRPRHLSGRLDPGAAKRRRAWIANASMLMAAHVRAVMALLLQHTPAPPWR
jgi:hypothetical protein